ncbi:MAG: gliding motility-associated C-terminal domain-containing protein [Flavobacteriales bacterium]
MKIYIRSILIVLCCTILSFVSKGQDEEHIFLFKQNKGQWNSKVNFKADILDGAMFLENTGITYHFVDKSFIRKNHANKNPIAPESVHGHVIKVNFNKANKNPKIYTSRKASHYENYFIGNDSTQWASNIGIFNEVTYSEMYPLIDFKIYEHESNMKYDFIVKPGGNTKNISMEYQGADQVYIENDNLYVTSSLTDIIENKPFAYQIINGKKIKVPCFFKLKKNKVKFDFPEGYNKNYSLIIDPFLVFSTYSGSTSDNFGFTATYDTLGHTYAGGIVFGTGYPTTVGAYDSTFNGLSLNPVDIGITKYSLNGSNLLYSTYIGGSGDDAPHSLVTNDAGELYIFGSTSSNNFPTTAGCYDNTFNGGTNISASLGGTGMQYTNGSDAIIIKLNSIGTVLLSSTYVGGSGNDAITLFGGLNRNYGDEFRGEIILDANDNCIIATNTTSTNFPVVSGLTSRGGSSDAIVMKLNSNLTTLLWSTHLGGNSVDAAYGVQQDAAGNTFVVGGTTSSNLTSAQNTNSGGVDGFIAKYSSTNALLTTRYVGTSLYDQIYFVQIDDFDSVYIYGQSLGNMPVTAGKYNNSGSHQFLQKFNNNINVLNFSTVFGTGNSTIDISPSAFLVNDCGLIYMSGWGGTVNSSGSTTTGLPVSAGAFQTTTTGSDFYLIVLDENATGLNYATFFGGNVSAEHVDGGTSRFDKKGNVYQAVCAGCGGNNDFPTSIGAYSTTNGSSNCNLGVFKFNINEIKAIASVPSVIICYPSAASFGNNSRNGNTFHWDFGDGNTSSAFAPTHIYSSAGLYNVILTVSDSTGCIKPDTALITVNVFDPASAIITADTSICPNTNIQLNASGGSSYVWSPAATLSNPFVANPIASPTGPTTYQVIVTNPCGMDTSYVNIGIHSVTSTTSKDTTICNGDTARLLATGGGNYFWTPNSRLINQTSDSPLVFPNSTTQYNVSITTPEGCPTQDSILITVIDIPQPIISNNDSICAGSSISLIASGADSYRWSPSTSLNTNTGSNVNANPSNTTTYYVDFTNICATLIDSVTVFVIKPEAVSSPNDTICFNQTALIWASGGVSYSWSPSSAVSSPSGDTTIVSPILPTTFKVIITDANGCIDSAFTTINFSPIPSIYAGENQIINFGETANLLATSSPGTFYWSFHTSLSDTVNKATTAQPSNTTQYVANLVDDFGCLVSDTVVISLDGSLYVPNSFSPNDDGKNDVFRVQGEDITNFRLFVFNRWGEQIFESTSIAKAWDGTHKGQLCKVDSYVWKIIYSDANTSRKEIYGHVNLIK